MQNVPQPPRPVTKLAVGHEHHLTKVANLPPIPVSPHDLGLLYAQGLIAMVLNGCAMDEAMECATSWAIEGVTQYAGTEQAAPYARFLCAYYAELEDIMPLTLQAQAALKLWQEMPEPVTPLPALDTVPSETAGE